MFRYVYNQNKVYFSCLQFARTA